MNLFEFQINFEVRDGQIRFLTPWPEDRSHAVVRQVQNVRPATPQEQELWNQLVMLQTDHNTLRHAHEELREAYAAFPQAPKYGHPEVGEVRDINGTNMVWDGRMWNALATGGIAPEGMVPDTMSSRQLGVTHKDS